LSDAPRAIVVIPAFNEAVTIRDVVSRALTQIPRVIVVDDGSSDGTAAALADLPVTVSANPCNMGKGASLWRGMSLALAEHPDVVITLDGDGQHAPECIPIMIAAWSAHRDKIVVGARLWDRNRFPPLRYFGNRFANFWIAWAAGYSIIDSQSGYRLYPADVLRRVRVAHDRRAGFTFESEFLIEAGRLGIRSVFVQVATIYPRHARASHYRTARDTWRIVRMVAWSLISRGLYLPGLIQSMRSTSRD